MTDKKKITLNQKQEFVAKKLEEVLFEHSLSLEKLIFDLKEKDNDFMLHLKSLSNDEFFDLYEHFGIDMEGGTIKQNKGNLLLSRYALDILEDEFTVEMPAEKDIN
jgi:hypothetical protein